jgi:hypothetical protein
VVVPRWAVEPGTTACFPSLVFGSAVDDAIAFSLFPGGDLRWRVWVFSTDLRILFRESRQTYFRADCVSNDHQVTVRILTRLMSIITHPSLPIPALVHGCKLYQLLAGHQNISSSYLVSRSKAFEGFPMPKSAGLVGAVVHNDARMNLALISRARWRPSPPRSPNYKRMRRGS